ncbi:MAG: septal ring lytic transglycosylase RlpA family protein [Pseudomonadota bacterium]
MMSFSGVLARLATGGAPLARIICVNMPYKKAFASLACAFALAGCAAFSDLEGSGRNNTEALSAAPGGGDGIDDDALGVSASPVVTTRYRNLRRGGGRDQVGRPYRIGGRLYTPREDPNYDRTGMASWYGPGFHGRLTANGEVFDQYTLSAAHPTLPLPSYVRVTNLDNDHSVVVRVNDRGPFAHNRIIDLSKRAADVLDMRADGVGRVRVQYLDRAPLHGQDVEWLEASARIPGNAPQASDTMFASAPVFAPVRQAAAGAVSALTPTPAPQPVRTATRAPATAVPALASAPEPTATSAPLVLAPPIAPRAVSAVPSFAPIAPGRDPRAPIPSATVGLMPIAPGAEPIETRAGHRGGLAAGFTQRNQDARAHSVRIASAHGTATAHALDAASALALQSQTLLHAQTLAQVPATAPVAVGDQTASFQIGVFGDAANVVRVRGQLGEFGRVVTEPISSRGRTLTRVELQVRVADRSAADVVLQRLAGQGYTDAYLIDVTRS